MELDENLIRVEKIDMCKYCTSEEGYCDCDADLLFCVEDEIEQEFTDRTESFMNITKQLDDWEDYEWAKLITLIKKKHGIIDDSLDAVNVALLKKIKKVGVTNWLKGIFGYGFSRGMIAGYSRELMIHRKVNGRFEE